MRRYAPADEARIALQGQVRDWTGAGLLSAQQGAQLESELKVTLRRTGRMLRAGLALFTVLAAAAAVGFVMLLLNPRGEGAVSVILLIGGAGYLVSADRLVATYRLYRHGVEEALAVAGVALVSVGIGVLISTGFAEVVAIISALAAGAVGGFAMYRRFGLRYTAVAAIACLAFIPLQLKLPLPARTLLASGVLAVIFVVASRVRGRHQDEAAGDEARTLEVAAILGAYLMLNLHITARLLGFGGRGALVPWFKWTTYVLVWVLPPAIGWFGVRHRERQLVDVGIVSFFATLMTNKQYLGLPTKPWDPILLGLFTVGVTIAVRRWIAAGPGQERGGFTCTRVSAQEGDVIAVVGTASAAFHPGPVGQPDSHERPGFDGGRSGGAGGGADF